jgi:hypothetical protein
MSAQDVRAEREVADFYDASQRPVDPDRGPLWPRVKRFGAAVLTGLALGSTIDKLF